MRWPLAGALLLAGCISSGPLAKLARVPDDQAARIVVARPAGFGSGTTTAILVDGVRAYGLDAGEHVELTIAAGERILEVKTWDSSGMFGALYPAQVLQAEAGRVYYYRIGAGVMGSGHFDRTTEAEGQQLMRETATASPSPSSP